MNLYNYNKGDEVMTTTIRKWGNSLGLRIPQNIAKKYGVDNGSEVELIDNGKQIIIKPLVKEPTLDDLLEQCTPDRRHEEIDWGKPLGKEI
ncbi:antitoxin MazE [Natronobacillus azotifigens]|uniref:AbrB/MazE/SpoVT family DNA-binding domain-containing protein n=1 Tax=Natronobacillus azotifigens TaxID=472978 RepID=A0A9J6R9Q3_9BACI|nr:AbrB/MazE/SpoVT family DNA-binding domain-containing protein [Natronobacillus azotifigens]MCZ0702012.1 AbrB/MazE/SpoVT family DNA-binding domain-containing protein [Natronobacillus azotifigens]